MFILDMSKLEVGDILLTREKAVLSKGVRFFSQGEYSHAMLYVARGSYIHSDNKGVHSDNIQRKLFKEVDDVKVVRIIESSYVKKACDYARHKVGTQYSVKDAIKSVLPKTNKVPNDKQFCSRLVAESYKYAGLNLVKDPHFCTPSELDISPYVKEVVGCVKLANDIDLGFAESANPIAKQTIATNLILNEARRLTGKKIQNFQDLDNALLVDDSFDAEISKVAVSSGYYKYISIDLAKNPWRYNGEVFMSLPMSKDELVNSALDELNSARERFLQYSRMYEYSCILCSLKNLQYFHQQQNLYKEILNSIISSVDAATYVLKECGADIS